MSIAGQEAGESFGHLPLLLRRQTRRKHVPLVVVSRTRDSRNSPTLKRAFKTFKGEGGVNTMCF